MAADFSDSAPTVRDLVTRRAIETPEAVYLIAPETGSTLTFGELHGRCLTLARDLAGLGIQRGDRVGLFLPNGLQAAGLFVGIMAAGCVATPLSLLLQPEPLAFVLTHSDCRLVFTTTEHRRELEQALARLPIPGAVAVRVIDAECGSDDGAGTPDAAWPLAAPANGSNALLMYTSGTTGRPKGVRLSHGNVLSGARFVSQAHGLGPSDRVLAVLPLYHINAQIVTVLAPLYHGGSLVMPRRFSAGRFWSLAAEHRCTWLNVVPTIIAYLLNGEENLRADLDLGAVRFCRSASAPLAPEHHRAFEQRFGIGIIETMGLTETAAPVFTNPLNPALRKIGSPGRAFGNLARIAAPGTERPQPAGMVGEIQISGPNVMSGYHKDPAETASAFTADGWLKTGDLGYRDDEGFYFVTGRLKELIIKGGENIAPREIDETLLKHPALLEAAAVGVPDPLYGQEIEAGVVLKPGMTATEEELKIFCEDRLGRFKTPRVIRIMTELPKGPSGKVQRLRLLQGAGHPHPTRSAGTDRRHLS
ncbi:AMP-binding protein [Telmatospirillum siberiense]|uniref:Long-chain fatty acid--CoA ligase n=1 Tax=Telmatospirillum siberiense TaxID=382514 RepID=A0A2N3PU94_9PROT|nr:AMP-binding protein [Telmatospirillum siberiense]PKU23972.1 long-chain fatty acid--CoA ligase [Telmatospirillum siberiense]